MRLADWMKYLEKQQEKAREQRAPAKPAAPAPPAQPTPSAQPRREASPEATTPAVPASQAPVAKPKRAVRPRSRSRELDADLADEVRQRQELLEQAERESPEAERTRLLRELLDPELSLQQTAVLLGVSVTSLRRYTDSGVLPHLRTAGNQRRFRLSQVLGFLAERSKRKAEH